MLTDPEDIAKALCERHKSCIKDLSAEWKTTGYSRVDADILWALGDSDLHGAFAALVDCVYHREENRSPNYRHRLLPLGVKVKSVLEKTA